MITALEGGEGSASRPGRSLPRERPGTHCTGGWVGPRAGPDRCGKSRPQPGFDPWTVQPVASRYTDYANRSSREHTLYISTRKILLGIHVSHNFLYYFTEYLFCTFPEQVYRKGSHNLVG